jgi:uncharacterized Zn-binding protein involved in type VI secretion
MVSELAARIHDRVGAHGGASPAASALGAAVSAATTAATSDAAHAANAGAVLAAAAEAAAAAAASGAAPSCGEIHLGAPTVLIEGRAAARLGDVVSHGAARLTQGSLTVSICGVPAARSGDASSCGGRVVSHASATFIGGSPSSSTSHPSTTAAVAGALLSELDRAAGAAGMPDGVARALASGASLATMASSAGGVGALAAGRALLGDALPLVAALPAEALASLPSPRIMGRVASFLGSALANPAGALEQAATGLAGEVLERVAGPATARFAMSVAGGLASGNLAQLGGALLGRVAKEL